MTQYDTKMPGLAYEFFDGELIVADYMSGLYYSISSPGAAIWKALHAGYTVDAIVERFSTMVPELDFQRTIPEFVALLTTEKLIAPRASAVECGDWPAIEVAELGEPALERFDDLQDLLLLDPVHDVSEQGWPHRG